MGLWVALVVECTKGDAGWFSQVKRDHLLIKNYFPTVGEEKRIRQTKQVA
jgi:hypothetical protein